MKLSFGKKKDKEKSSAETEDVVAAPVRTPKNKKSTPPKKWPFPRQSRFTLLIGDEGAILIHMKGNTVLSRQFVPDASPANLDVLRDTMVRDRIAPITMIIDSVDQAFVQQTLPPVSFLSVQKLIKRRLERDFKPDDIKGAVILGREKGGRKDWNFLMISVEKSPQMVLWLEFIMTFENRFRGIVVLSVEAGIFIRNLERALGIPLKTGTGSEWKILVSHNKVGGFRQIILRDGRLIFTRLALPVGEPRPAVIAGNIEQEIINTVEYLKRFGYAANRGLDVYVIASEDVCGFLDMRRLEARNFQAFSAHAMATLLGMKGATQTTDQFGDVVLAAAVGSIRKNTLTLTTKESRQYDQMQLLTIGQRLIGTFGILGLVVYAAYSGYATLLLRSEVQDSEQKQRINEQALEDLKKQITDSKLNIELVGNQIEVYRQIKTEARSPVSFFAMLTDAIPKPILLKSVRWQLGDGLVVERIVPSLLNYNLEKPDATASTATAKKPPTPPPAKTSAVTAEPSQPQDTKIPTTDIVTAVLVLEFPAGIRNAEVFKRVSDKTMQYVHEKMPEHTLAYTSVPPEYLEAKGLQLNFEQNTKTDNTGKLPFTVELTVRGVMPITPEGAVTP